MEIPDLTKLTWPLNVALTGAVFSVFALIYNTHFIYYGFLTFLYGIACHIVDNMYSFWLKDKSWGVKFVFLSQIVSTFFWVFLLTYIY